MNKFARKEITNVNIVNTFNELFERKTDNVNVELEIRLKNLNYDDFIKELTKLGNNTIGELEKSINFIDVVKTGSHTSTNKLQKVTKIICFDSTIKSENTEYYEKKKIIDKKYMRGSKSYTVSVATEKKIPKFKSGNSCITRFKSRFSIIDKNKKWRLDFTAVKQNPLLPPIAVIKNDIKIMFNDYNANNIEEYINYIGKINELQQLTYEIEYEYIDKNTIDESVINNMVNEYIEFNDNNDDLLQNSIYEVAQLLLTDKNKINKFKNQFKLKALLNQVYELNKNEYIKIYPPEGYLLTDKADGITMLIYIKNGVCKLLYGNTAKVFQVTGFNGILLAIGEYINEDNSFDKITGNGDIIEETGNILGIILLFDILIYSDNSDSSNLKETNYIHKFDIEKRIKYLDKAANIITIGINVKCIPKEFTKLERLTLKETINSVYNKERPYKIDGLIFTECNKPYFETMFLKWKEIPTIDFLCMECPPILLNKYIYNNIDKHKLFLLFNGINKDMFIQFGIQKLYGYDDIFDNSNIKFDKEYFPIQFSPSSHPNAYLFYISDKELNDIYAKYNIDTLNEKLVELTCEVQNDNNDNIGRNWKFVNLRNDRVGEFNYFGNNIRIAEKTWINIIDKFELTDLWNIKSGYFTKAKDSIYHPQVSFNSYVKTHLIDELANSEWVIDIASGKGQDLSRYYKANIKNILFIDIDKIALAELITRKYELKKNNEGHNSSFSIYVLCADINEDYKKTLQLMSKFNIPICYGVKSDKNGSGVNHIVCNLAIHYFLASQSKLNNLVFLIKNMLGFVTGAGKKKTKGASDIIKQKSFTYTCFNGKKVFDILSNIKIGETWNVMQDNVLKYSIKKLYKATTFGMGLKIGVYLPFSGGEYYEEYLVDIDHVNNTFINKGFKISQSDSFSQYMFNFEKDRKDLFAKLTQQDKEYIDLLHYCVLTIL